MKRLRSTMLLLAALVLVGCSLTTTSSMDRGAILYHDGQYAAAVDAFSAAIAANPHAATAWNNRAAARLRAGDVNGAIGDYTRALELNSSDAKAAFNRGTAYALLGQRPLAQAEWARAVALESDPWTRAAMQRSAGLGPAPALVSGLTPDTAAQNVASAPAPGTGSGTVPPPRTPSSPTAIAPVPPAGVPPVLVTPSVVPSASPQALDARALAARAVTRELDGDHAGAMQDLNTALTLEPDAGRRARIAKLLRLMETPR